MYAKKKQIQTHAKTLRKICEGTRKAMNRVCRKVDSEYVECTACGKKLTIRVLAYKHAKTCQAYNDRVAKRTAQAHERHQRTLEHMKPTGNAATNEENEAMMNTT